MARAALFRGFSALANFCTSFRSHIVVAMPATAIRTGKYQSAVWSIPAAPPRKTSALVHLSVMTFCDNWTAASATIPTVAALRPERRAYTASGNVSPIRETPNEKQNMPTAPGRLETISLRMEQHSCSGCHLHMRKERTPLRKPPWMTLMLNNILVLAGPGNELAMAKSS